MQKDAVTIHGGETVIESSLLTRRNAMKYQDELVNLTSFHAQQ